MERFIVNMAIIRVNLDKNRSDILDNYIPLVHEALNTIESDVFSVDEFKQKFIELAEFKIPTGAILSLLKKSVNKYGLLEKQATSEYKIIKEKINTSNIIKTRNAEQRKYNKLVSTFVKYSLAEQATSIKEEEASNYFFEVLYDIAPALFMNINEIENIQVSRSDKKKYLVAKFISYTNKYDNDSFDTILSFVRGSMLTETFYYSQNFKDITNKPLRKTIVYFDTQFLVRLLGYAESSLCIPCVELVDMLKEMNVKMRCFRQTFDEIHGIFFAALNYLSKNGILQPNKPGDVFDYINRENITHSDLLLVLETIESQLNENNIYIEEKHDIIDAYSIQEDELSEELNSVFENQSEKARNHDIDCLQAIHQIREGKRKSYLESCKAIFITTNPQLARISTLFFNKHYGHSNAPVCMADHVFTALVWMKLVKKAPDLPKDRLVANCYSALMPTDSLWSDYINEVNRLKDKGTINEHDYHVLIHSITAREQLMDQVYFGSEENIFGSVDDILKKAKRVYTEELGQQLETTEKKSKNQREKIEDFAQIISQYTSKIILVLSIACWSIFLLYSMLYTKPDSIVSIADLKNLSYKSVFFCIFVTITLLNLIFGFKLYSLCRGLSNKVGNWISEKIRSKLIQQ